MIGISQVLQEIDITVDEAGKPVFFSIEYVTSEGKIKRIPRAQKNVKLAHAGGDKSPGSSFKYKLKEKGVVLLFDTDGPDKSTRYRTAKISHIIRFNGQEVHH